MAAHERHAATTRIQAEIAKYPDRRGAILPALRLAQEEYGWLSPEAIEEVADAIGFTPGYCQAVASFYDMFFLEPVGDARDRGLHEPLVRARRRRRGRARRFEQELGIDARRDDRRRRDHAAQGRVPRRLRLGPGRRGRRALPRALQAQDAAAPSLAERSAQTAEAALRRDPPAVPRTGSILLDFEGDRRDIAAYEAAGGYAQLRARRCGLDERRRSSSELKASGLRGRGGAGFPTGRKASFLAAGRSRATSSSTPTSRSPARSRTAS